MNDMNHWLEHLNPEQLAAVTLPAQSALILAGAGSGKTRVLTTRIAWLLQTGQISPQGILAVTFTNKASKEMTMRLSTMVPIQTRHMWMGTFHGLCHRFLRTHYRDAGLVATFQILDSQDQLSAIKRLLKSLNVDQDRYPAKNLMYFINGAKDQGLRSHAVDAFDDHERKMVEWYEAYEKQCQHEGVVDFAELLLRTYELLATNQALREHYQDRFKHILVDEFQDTNNLQYQWLKLMAGHGTARVNAVFAVGDDDQSIYAFRGANVGNMAAFEREFQVQNLIKLEQNYRSHGHILDAANDLIANNAVRLGKNLRTDAGHGEPVRVLETASDLDEARWLVEEVKQLAAEGMAYRDIAILYRSNAQSRVIEHALFGAGIVYRVYGGQRFFERAEVKHALAYLQLMENLHNNSAFLRVVNFPARGIGTRSIEQLQEAALQYDVSLYAAVPYVAGKAGSSLGQFVRLMERLREESQQASLSETIRMVTHQSGLIAHYQNEKEGADRVENLLQLEAAADVFLMEEGLDPPTQSVSMLTAADVNAVSASSVELSLLSAFLVHASLESGGQQALEGQDAVQVMTVHSAKGLEFDGVFITGLEEGLFPHEQSSQTDGGIEEERRLMYVAITRARKRLYLSYAQTRMLHGQTRYGVRSRFIDELPDEALKWLSPKITHHWRGARHSAWDENGASESNEVAQRIHQKETGWRVGETVAHAKFGEGVIIRIEGSGTQARASINFGRQGIKLLDLSVARLEKQGV